MKIPFLRFAALALSLAVHILVATAIVRAAANENASRESATLEVSRMELSILTHETEAPPEDDAPPVEAHHPAPFPKPEPPIVAPPDPDGTILPPPPKLEFYPIDPPEMKVDLSPTPDHAAVDAPPKPEKAISPKYPREARLKGREGTVSLRVIVAETGTVTQAEILSSSGTECLDRAALDAVRAARFTPARRDGVDIESTITLAIVFRLK